MNLEARVSFFKAPVGCVESGRKLIATFPWLVAYGVHKIGINPVHQLSPQLGRMLLPFCFRWEYIQETLTDTLD